MDRMVHINKVRGLKAIQAEALRRADQGEDAFKIRNFVDEAKKKLAYENPDEDAFEKAVNATLAYRKGRLAGSGTRLGTVPPSSN